MKKPLIILALLMATTLASKAQIRISLDVISGNRAPNATEAKAMRNEEMGHPAIMEAIRNVQRVLQAMQNAGDNFGGHRTEAITNLKAAYISLRKALYYRLYEDRR